MFGDDLLGSFFDEEEAGAERPARPPGRGRHRESADLTEYLSLRGEEILQQAARTAVE